MKYLVLLAILYCSVCSAQTLGPQPLKIDINYTATSRGLKLQWNSNHLSKKLEVPSVYKYRTDYGVGLSKKSTVSFFLEGTGVKRDPLSFLTLDYDRSKDLGFAYSIKDRDFFFNLQFNQKYNPLRPMSEQGQSLKLDLGTKF